MKARIYCRESTGMQRYKRNLDTYEKKLRSELEKRGIPIVGVHRVICSGWMHDDRWALKKAVRQAQKDTTGKTVIVAPSTDRFLRNKFFTTKKPDTLPTEAEFEQLMELTGGVPLVTLLPPDMSPRKVRGYQTRWGQQVKGNKGGRPKKNKPGYKKEIRLEKKPRALKYREGGASITDIALYLGVPRPTVQYWIEHDK